MKMKILITYFLCTVMLTSCKQDIEEITRAVDQYVATFDAIQSDWKESFDKNAEQFPQTLGDELDKVGQRAVEALHNGVKCDHEYLNSYYRDKMRNVTKKYLNQHFDAKLHIAPLPPFLCNVLPAEGLNFNLVKDNKEQVIEIFGFDLDPNNYKIFLHSKIIDKLDVSQHLSKIHHYKNILNVSASGLKISPDNYKFTIEQNDKILYTIPIIMKRIPPVLKVHLIADGDPNQCKPCGPYEAELGTWTSPIRIDTDNRPGGCYQVFSISDPQNELDGLQIYVELLVGDKSDPGQCNNVGKRPIPINKSKLTSDWSSPYRLDMDNRAGWCTQRFYVEGRNDVALKMKFWSDGDAGQCHGQGEHSASIGKPIQINLDTDGRAGGCQQSFMLVKI